MAPPKYRHYSSGPSDKELLSIALAKAKGKKSSNSMIRYETPTYRMEVIPVSEGRFATVVYQKQEGHDRFGAFFFGTPGKPENLFFAMKGDRISLEGSFKEGVPQGVWRRWKGCASPQKIQPSDFSEEDKETLRLAQNTPESKGLESPVTLTSAPREKELQPSDPMPPGYLGGSASGIPRLALYFDEFYYRILVYDLENPKRARLFYRYHHDPDDLSYEISELEDGQYDGIFEGGYGAQFFDKGELRWEKTSHLDGSLDCLTMWEGKKEEWIKFDPGVMPQKTFRDEPPPITSDMQKKARTFGTTWYRALRCKKSDS
jgi:hypothetical protein